MFSSSIFLGDFKINLRQPFLLYHIVTQLAYNKKSPRTQWSLFFFQEYTTLVRGDSFIPLCIIISGYQYLYCVTSMPSSADSRCIVSQSKYSSSVSDYRKLRYALSDRYFSLNCSQLSSVLENNRKCLLPAHSAEKKAASTLSILLC